MSNCAQVLARTLRDAGVTRMFGLPGGEILDFIEAAHREGIEFVLTRDEATAAFMADVTGQIQRKPGVCVATLGPGAVNMALGVANAYLDRSPVIAVTAALARSAQRFATHQNLDLNAVYRPFTKSAVTLDGRDTAGKVREAVRTTIAPRMGPVHIALPSDVARSSDSQTVDPASVSLEVSSSPPPDPQALEAVAAEIHRARRPIVILGLDLDPYANVEAVRRFVEQLGAPTFVTPKAKGVLSADHPLFFGVCAGVAGDAVIVDLFSRADLLIGIGFDPVESDKLWHHTMKLVSVGPVSIATGDYRPYREAVGDVNAALEVLGRGDLGPFDWADSETSAYRRNLDRTLRPAHTPGPGLSGYEVTRRLRHLAPRDTILVTDVGSIKSVTSQCWDTFAPLTFFESNGLSAMSYGFRGAMAARLLFPDRPVVCTIGDGGFGMTLAEIETCVRHRLHFVTVVYNDNSLSLIKVSQERKGYPNYGVDYGVVNFAAVAEALGAWSRQVTSLDELEQAFQSALRIDRPAVIDVPIDLREYRAHNADAIAAVPLQTPS
jgi:acetolactate synthase I/II/III large subunit